MSLAIAQNFILIQILLPLSFKYPMLALPGYGCVMHYLPGRDPQKNPCSTLIVYAFRGNRSDLGQQRLPRDRNAFFDYPPLG